MGFITVADDHVQAGLIAVPGSLVIGCRWHIAFCGAQYAVLKHIEKSTR